MNNDALYTPADFKNTGPVPEEGIAAAVAVMRRGNLFRYSDTNPRESPVYRLEQWFVEYTGYRYALAVNSCTSAIELALEAFGVKQHDRVLIPAFTFGAVPSSVKNAGFTPILVECDQNLKIDLGDLRKKAAGCQALLLSYMRGRIPNMDAIMEVCEEHALLLIEDCAHGMGGYWNGRAVGTFGDAACYSFQDYKILPAGDGGMVTTNGIQSYAFMVYRHGAYEDLWRKNLPDANAKEVRAFEELANRVPFHNYRMSNLTAAVLLPQLPLLEARADIYRRNYQKLAGLLADADAIEIPGDDALEHRVLDSIQFRLRGFTPAQVEAFITLVKKRGIPIAGLGEPGNARAPWGWLYLKPTDLPRTREYLSNACDLRLAITLTDGVIHYLADAFIESVGAARQSA